WPPGRDRRPSHRPLLSLRSALFLIDLKRQLGVDIAAVVACAVRELGVAALGATNVMNRLKGQMSPAFPLTRFAVFLDWKHNGDSCSSCCPAENDVAQRLNGRQPYPPTRRCQFWPYDQKKPAAGQ